MVFTVGEKNAGGRPWLLVIWSEPIFKKLKGVLHVAAAMWFSICDVEQTKEQEFHESRKNHEDLN